MRFFSGAENIPRLFSCVALCLLWTGEYRWAPGPGIPKTSIQDFLLKWGHQALSFSIIGHAEAWITQSPRYEITVTGETVALQCYQTYNHDCVYWYQQDQGHGLRLIFYTCDVGILNKEEVPNGYNVSRPSMKDFSLILESVVPSRTSVYLCASSNSTVLHSCFLCAHKGDLERVRIACPCRVSPKPQPLPPEESQSIAS